METILERKVRHLEEALEQVNTLYMCALTSLNDTTSTDRVTISKEHFNKMCQFALKHKHGKCDCFDATAKYPYDWRWMRLRGYLKEWLTPHQYDIAKECLEVALKDGLDMPRRAGR